MSSCGAASGVPDRSLFRLMAQNIRNSDQVLGDVESMVTANALGAQRLVQDLLAGFFIIT